MSQAQSYQDQVASKLAELLSELPKSEQALQMAECERAAFQSGYLNSTPRMDSPFVFSVDLLDDPGMRMLLAKDSEYRNALGAETASELVLRLLPSAGHLD